MSTSANLYLCPQCLEVMRQKIRYAKEPDNPALISEWMSFTSCPVDGAIAQRRRSCVTQFNLLLDAVADECLPVHWRNICLDNIYYPLLKIKNLSDCEASDVQVRNMFYELKVMSHYLAPGLSYNK